MMDGNVAFGIIESETTEEISMKGPTGVVTKHLKVKVKSRVQQAISLMPPGLHLTMNEAELVDLIEYLASLKKKWDQPGGQVISRPPSMCRCRWGTVSPASWPLLKTNRKPFSCSPSSPATSRAFNSRWPST